MGADEDSNMTLIIVIIAAVAVVLLVIVVFFVCYYKMKLRQQANDLEAQNKGSRASVNAAP